MQLTALARPIGSMAIVAHPGSSLRPTPAAPPVAPGADELRARWLGVVTARTGIDFADWDPALGTAHNRDTIRASYRYYARLFLEHPEFEWAGMANAIAPTFAAAFDDLAIINEHLRRWSRDPSSMPQSVKDALSGGPGDATEGVLPVAQMRHVETTFLGMQRKIFVDQAIMHEAYLAGGLPAIDQLRRAGVIDDRAQLAWAKIDEGRAAGRPELVSAGNVDLLWREQMQVVADDYDSIRTWSRSSRLMTYVLTCLGRPAIPGSRTPGQAVPIQVGRFRMPVPAIDVSRREDRWRMIELDTLPAYHRLLRAEPASLRALVASDLDGRIASGRLRRLPGQPSPRDLASLFQDYATLTTARGRR